MLKSEIDTSTQLTGNYGLRYSLRSIFQVLRRGSVQERKHQILPQSSSPQ